MKHALFVTRRLLLAVSCELALAGSGAAAATSTPARSAAIAGAYRGLPIYFEANQGQADPHVRFVSRGAGHQLFLTPDEAVLSVRRRPAAEVWGAQGLDARPRRPVPASHPVVLRMRLVGANREPRLSGLDEIPATVNYFTGRDPQRWCTGVPAYGKVKYEAVYPGIDLVYHGDQGTLEYDFLVSPGADPGRITLAFEGAWSLALDRDGNLVLETAAGPLRERVPRAYQEVDGVRHTIAARYVRTSGRQVGFRLARYDRSRPLIIDPQLAYSTFLGGTRSDVGNDIAVAGDGSVYVTGTTDSFDFPAQNPPPPSGPSASNVFVAKLSPTTAANPIPTLLFAAYLGGIGLDEGRGIALDSNDNVYVAGVTSSFDFPTTPNAPQPDHAGGTDVEFPTDAFVAKLNASGSALLYATYLGGSNEEFASDIAVDVTGTAYVTGQTGSDDFPNVAPSPDPTVKGLPFQLVRAGAGDAFVARLDPAADAAHSLLYSTFLGGSGSDTGTAITVDLDGHVWVTGATDSANFPTVNPLQSHLPGFDPFHPFDPNVSNIDAFVTKISPLLAGQAGLLYSTYFGGRSIDVGNGIAVDASRRAYITGVTTSGDLPLAHANDTTRQGSEAFVASIGTGAAGGKNLLFSTYVGGSGADVGQAIALDAGNNAWITGRTTSLDIPGIQPRPAVPGGTASDAFVARIVPRVAVDPRTGAVTILHGVDFGTYLAGSDDEQGNGIAVASDGSVSVIGSTASSNFPTLDPLPLGFAGGQKDAFVVKISPTGAGLSGVWKRVTQQCEHRDERGCEVHGVLDVHNPGTQTAAASVIRFFLSADDTLDERDRLLKEAVLRPLRAGRTRSKTVRVRLDASVGGQFLIAVLDATNIVPEANESNNVVVSPAISREPSNDRELTVIGRGPNLSLPSLPLVDGKLVAQLVAEGGVCFEDALSAVRNDGKVVEAVID